MDLRPCAACTELVAAGTCVCPHCGEKACRRPGGHGAAAVLLGLSLVACGSKDSGETSTTSSPQPDYGVTVTTGTTASSRHAPDLVEILEAKIDREADPRWHTVPTED